MRYLRFCTYLFVPLLATAFSTAQTTCPALTIPQVIPGRNMFSVQQEVWLGEIQGAEVEQSLAVLQNMALTKLLQDTVDELARPLPPDHIPFRVRIVDSSTADAFSVAGGRIYVSRKIIAVVQSQDELAGLLAHEMGHILAHHAAIETSQSFRKVLGINELSSREDVVARWNEWLSNYRRQRGMSYENAALLDEREQTQADTIALYLLTRAGYSAQAFQKFFDRLAQTKGRTGGFWSNLFGTNPDAKRLGQIIKNTPSMPPSCMQASPVTAAAFETWKKSIIESTAADFTHEESIPGLLSKRVLTERLRAEVENIRISPDGRYVLAQDDASVYVVERHPLKPVFRFPAADAEKAQFAPDSRNIVLLFAAVGASPRVERWDITTQKRAEVHEVYVRDGCLLAQVSPDGKTLACLTEGDYDPAGIFKFDMQLYDVEKGSAYWQKKTWAKLDFGWWTTLEFVRWLTEGLREFLPGLMATAFSPNGHYLVAHSEQNTLAFDLLTHTAFQPPANVKALLNFTFAFDGENRLVGATGDNGGQAEVVTFPAGASVYKGIGIGRAQLEGVAHGDHVLLRPVKDNAVGALDLKQNKPVVASKRNGMDLWDNESIAERLDGDLQVFDLSTMKAVEQAQLPDGPLGTVRAKAVSPDLNWLAVSEKSRGAVWNLQTGKRVYHLRGFSSAYFAPDGQLYADFPKNPSTDRVIVRAALNTSDLQVERKVDDKTRTIQAGPYLLTFHLEKAKNPTGGVSFELTDMLQKNVVWTKNVVHERPGYYLASSTDSIALYWKANSQSAKSIAKEDNAAAASIARFKDKDSALFLQVFDLSSGKLRSEFAFDTGKHSFQIEQAMATRDRVIITDDQGRVLVYSPDGQLKGTIAGSAPELSISADLMTVHTESGELELYDLATMQKRNAYAFPSDIAVNAFSGDGKRLLVLTADQTVYMLDPAASDKTAAVAER
jgi:WD40 repeat protein